MSAGLLPPGSVLDGYEIVSLLGRGGMGAVYRARRPGSGEVALKTLLGEVSVDEKLRFRREAELLASLRHPSIVPIHAAGHAHGLVYFAMGLIEGESLDARIRREGPLELAEAARIVLEVADAVAFAHERRIIHRDLKPANVLLEKGGRALVTDFGLARQMGESERERLTRTGEILGTPAFMSPEQAYGRTREIDERTDVYGLGAILYATLAGRPPFEAATAMETIMLVCEREPAPLEGVPLPLADFVRRALAKDRKDRPPSARAFAAELEEALAARPPLPRWLVRGVGLALLLSVTTLALTVRAKLEGNRRARLLSRVDAAASKLDLDAFKLAALAAMLPPEERARRAAEAADVAFTHSQWAVAEGFLEDAHEVGRLTGPLEDRRLAAHVLASSTIRENAEKLRRRGPTELAKPPLSLACAHLHALLLASAKPGDEQALDRLRELGGLPATPEQERAIAALWLAVAVKRSKEFVFDEKLVTLIASKSARENADLIHSCVELRIVPALRAFAQARAHDATVPSFPKELESFLERVRIVGGRCACYPEFAADWRRAFAGLETHPTLLFLLARIDVNGDPAQRERDAPDAIQLSRRVSAALAHDGSRCAASLARESVLDILRDLFEASHGSREVLQAMQGLAAIARSDLVTRYVAAAEKWALAPDDPEVTRAYFQVSYETHDAHEAARGQEAFDNRE